MIYSKTPNYGDGQWHCPFPKEWVEQMRKAVKHERIKHYFHQEHYLEQPQDSRGLPLSSKSDNNDMRCCATYDYESIPDVVISNGYDDWPLTIWKKMYNS